VPVPIPLIVKALAPAAGYSEHVDVQDTVLTFPVLVTVRVAFVKGVPPIVPLAVPVNV